MEGGFIVIVLVAVMALIVIAKTAIVVPQQSAYVVERLGRYSGTLDAGFHILLPFVDVIRYKHSLKEAALDIPAQVCITRDNTQLQVDGIIYFQVTDPMRASYGSSNYVLAITQLAQTLLRSVIGKMELDRTFEERDTINAHVVSALDEAARILPTAMRRPPRSNWSGRCRARINCFRWEKRSMPSPGRARGHACRICCR